MSFGFYGTLMDSTITDLIHDEVNDMIYIIQPIE